MRWAAILAAVFMLLTCLPYLFGLAIRPSGYYYSGLLTNPDDHNVYLSYMRQAHDGRLLFTDQFTTEPQRGLMLDVFWLALGLFARVTHLPLPIVYHLARVVAGWLLLMAVYWLAAQAITSPAGRRVALILTATASGFGWLFHPGPGQPHPVDYGPGLVMPEAITFLTLLLNPLFAFSVFLMVAALGLAAQAFASGRMRWAALAGLAGLVLGNIHSYDLIPLAVVLLAYLVYLLAARRVGARVVGLALVIGVIAAPSVLYQYWLLRTGEAGVLAKTVGQWGYSRAPVYVALGLGLPLMLALVGAARAVSRRAEVGRLLALWLVLGFALVYVPVSFQRKLVEGLHIPVCVLAVSALEPIWRHAPRRAVIVGALLVLIAVPSNALHVRRALGDLVTNNQAYLGNLMPPLYLRPDQYQALQWLNGKRTESDILLANTFVSNYAPSLAGVRVYVGHWSETLDYPRKLKELSVFLQAGTPDAEREAFCRGRGISYVLRDQSVYDDIFLPPSRQSGGGYQPDASPWLFPLFMQDRVALYWVLRPGESPP
jgi:hypothetical protein